MFETKEINTKKTWDEFLENHANKDASATSFIQSWNWSEFLQKQGQKIYRLGFFKDDKLIGLALGTKVCARRGKYLHFRHGPVIDWSDSSLSEFVLNELKKYAKIEKVWFVRISPLIKDKKIIQNHVRAFHSQMHGVDAEETWVLELKKSEEELLQQMRKNTRYSIRKAEKEGVEIIKTKDSKYLEEFWQIFQDTVKRHKWNAYTYDYIKDEFEIFAKDDQNMLFLAKYQGKYIAAAIFNFYLNQSVYHHSGSLSEFQKIPASYLIQWEAIKEAKRRGLKKHNFWGVPLDQNSELDKSHPWSGLGLFKVGFGGHAEEWIHAQDIPVSPLYWLTHFYEKLERKKKGY